MLDVARHYLPMDKIKSTIDAMASAKFNVLHMHLTDSQVFIL
jgi:hexosaminidase